MNTIRVIEVDIIISKIKFNNKIKSKCPMEIVKQNEVFNLKDTTDLFEMQGEATLSTSGSLHINFYVSNADHSNLADCYYNKYVEDNKVNFGVTCAEDFRKSFIEYAEAVIASVVEHFKSIV